MSSSEWACSTRQCPSRSCTPFPRFSAHLLNKDPLCSAAEVLERLHRLDAPVSITSPELIVTCAEDCNLALAAYCMVTYPGALVQRSGPSQCVVNKFGSEGLAWAPGEVEVDVDRTQQPSSPVKLRSPPKFTVRSPIRQKMVDRGELASKGAKLKCACVRVRV